MNGPPSTRRRRFLVKQWLQLRWMLLLAGGTVLVGVVYALILQGLLHRRIEPEMAASYSTLGSGNPVLALYPTVAAATLALAAGVVLFALIFLKVFTGRISGSSAMLESQLNALADGREGPSSFDGIPIPEFRDLAERAFRLTEGYRRKWEAIDAKAGAALASLDGIEGLSDPTQRLVALREFERKTASLTESCRPRQRGRE